MRYLVTAVVVGLALAAAPAAEKGDGKKDVELLQGTWAVVSSEQGGQDDTEHSKGFVLVIAKDKFEVKKGDDVLISGTFTVDASKKPRAIDMTITGGSKAKGSGEVARGIYELTKDSLKWCTAEPGKEDRPTEFKTQEANRRLLVNFKREKP